MADTEFSEQLKINEFQLVFITILQVLLVYLEVTGTFSFKLNAWSMFVANHTTFVNAEH
jgi:hypothetical protein